MNLKDNEQEIKENLNKFYLFLEEVPTDNYRERWKKLFDRGQKGRKKIDVWKAWNDDFSNALKIEWKKDISFISSYLANFGITSFTFYGLGHNQIITKKYDLNDIVEVLKENIEGLYIMDNNKTFLISNHDGDIIIYKIR